MESQKESQNVFIEAGVNTLGGKRTFSKLVQG